MPIIENGKSNWSIYVPKNSIAADKTAAKELQTHLQKITGTKLDVVTEKSVGNKPAFYIGNTKLFNKHFAVSFFLCTFAPLNCSLKSEH